MQGVRGMGSVMLKRLFIRSIHSSLYHSPGVKHEQCFLYKSHGWHKRISSFTASCQVIFANIYMPRNLTEATLIGTSATHESFMNHCGMYSRPSPLLWTWKSKKALSICDAFMERSAARVQQVRRSSVVNICRGMVECLTAAHRWRDFLKLAVIGEGMSSFF